VAGFECGFLRRKLPMLEDLGVFQVEIVKELNWKVLTAPRELSRNRFSVFAFKVSYPRACSFFV